jgi:hypothetical protein
MRKRLDRRIHCQRKANRDNWEIVESRRKWLGSQTAQRAFIHMRNRALSAEANLDKAKADVAEMAEARAALWERATEAEAKLREANMQALSDEGQMREIQAKLAQAVEAEREACAKLAESNADNDSRGDCPWDGGAGGMGYRRACYDIEQAIRARSASDRQGKNDGGQASP